MFGEGLRYCSGPGYGLGQAAAFEVAAAPVTGRKHGVGAEGTGEAALVEWRTGDHADVEFLALGQQALVCRLIEEVVDHLHGVHQSRFQQAQHRIGLVIVGGHPEEPDLALNLERRHRGE